MNKKLSFFLFALIAGLLLSLFPVNQVEAQSPDYELSSVTGVWTDVQGTIVHSPTGYSSVRWGYSANSEGKRSGFDFDGSTGEVFGEGEFFLLGTLTHINYPITSAADGATLQITLNFNHPSISPDPFTFNFQIEETTNHSDIDDCQDFQITDTPCDDRITFLISYGG
ncbi:MAG: choice-of-anchor K domain-containing protein, partial [Chloroflexota bacterium]|nr:choice-of-anchor K domain-containing protein [Chloroflexota bacterium]